MNRDLEVGMYVRTKDGIIGKYIQPDLGRPYITNGISFNEGANYGKYSHNIKDLIEVGDIITYEFPTGLGMLRYENVTVLEDLLNILKSSDEYKILTIITREQIESMQYKVD